MHRRRGGNPENGDRNVLDLKLKGRRALVTGASAGIGRAIATILAGEGVQVAISGRNIEPLHKVRDEIIAYGGPKPIVVTGDLSVQGGAQKVAEAVLSELGDVDILVNNAGGSRLKADPRDETVWQESMTLHFTSPRLLADALMPAMKRNEWGRIINITSSGFSKSVNPSTPAKAAIQTWAKALALQVASSGITVNCLGPGRIKTDQIMNKLHPTEESRRAFIQQNIAMGRFGEPEEFANLAVFLASPLAGYITGVTIHIDGGMARIAM